MQDMTVGNTTKRIVLFAIPLLFGNLLQQVYSMVDTVVVGRFVGYQALASVGVTVEVVSLLLGLALGMSNGVSVITAQLFGAKQMEKVRRSVAMGILLCGITSIVIGVVGVCFARPIYTLLKTPADIIDGAVLYTTIMFAGAPATLLYNYISSVLRAFGDSKTPLYGLAIASLVNIVLDLLFVVGFHWDIAGVGIATLISQLLAGVFCSLYAIKKLPVLRLQKGDFAWDNQLAASQLKVGIPLAFQQSVLAVGRLYMQAILNTLGTLTIAAYTVVSRIDMFLYSCMSAFGIATTTYAAQNFGARRIDRIDQGVKGACIVTVSICIGFTAVANLFAMPIIGSFVGAQEQAVIEMGVQYIRLVTPFYPLLGVIFVMHSAEQGIGKAVFAMLASFVELIARPAAAVFLTASFGYVGFCFANPAAWGSAFLMVFASYLLIIRKMKRQEEPFRPTHKQEVLPKMNMKRQWFSILLTSVLSISIFSGCSQGTPAASSPETTPAALPSASQIAESQISQAPQAMQIRISANDQSIVFQLNDSSAAKSLYEQLPLSIGVENYASNEKIFYPPEKLDTSDTPLLSSGGAGTLGYYAPWGDVIFYYGSCGPASGLYVLGTVVSGAEQIESLTGTIQIEAYTVS